MLPPRAVLVFLCLLAAWPAPARARSAKELIGDLQAALKDEAKTQKPDPEETRPDPDDAVPVRRGSAALYLAEQLNALFAPGEYEDTSILARISATSRSEKVQQICRELGVQWQAEHEQREADFSAAAEAAVKHAGEAVLQAKSEKDMDGILQEIGRLHADRNQSRSEVARRAASKLQSAAQFTTRWQDYLAQLKSDNFKAAREILRDLSQTSAYPIVARSEILARMQAVSNAEADAAREPTSSIPAKVAALCKSVQTPADIARVLPELKALHQEFPGEVDSTLVSELDNLGLISQQIQAGLSIPINLLDNARYFTDLRLGLVLRALPRYLGVSDRFNPLPQDTVGAFLDRVAADARKTADWPLLLKTVEASRSVAKDGANRGGTWNAAVEPLRAFIVGQNEEQAAQFASAVASYEAALKDTENLVPMTVVRDRLAAIKKEHPAEFEEGVQRALNPPVSYRYPPGFVPPPRPTPFVPPGR